MSGMSTLVRLENTLGPFAGMPLKRRSLDILVRIRMFESKMNGDNNPHNSTTVGPISGLFAKGALLYLRFHTGKRIN